MFGQQESWHVTECYYISWDLHEIIIIIIIMLTIGDFCNLWEKRNISKIRSEEKY